MKALDSPAIFQKEKANVFAHLNNCYLYYNRELFTEITGYCCEDISLYSGCAMFCYYASIQRTEKHTYFRRINQNFYSADYILAGNVYYRQGKHSFIAEPGDVVLLHPNNNTDILYPGDGPVESYGFCFSGVLLPELFRLLGLEQVFCLTVRQNSEFEECCKKLLKAVEKFKTLKGRLAASGCLYEFLQRLSIEGRIGVKDELSNQIRQYLRDHFKENISADDLAQAFQMSPPTLNKIFFQYFNQTPFRYLQHLRLEYAEKQLLESNRSIKDIALSSGFFSPQYFCSVFAKHYGKTAGEYRAEYWQKH